VVISLPILLTSSAAPDSSITQPPSPTLTSVKSNFFFVFSLPENLPVSRIQPLDNEQILANLRNLPYYRTVTGMAEPVIPDEVAPLLLL
jgi:hypothetical protein